MLAIIPDYFQPKSTFATFNQEFPLPSRLWAKWKNGVKLWRTKPFSKRKVKTRDDPITTEVIKRLLAAKVIATTVAGPYVNSLFYLINRDGSKLRAIFNYQHLTSSLSTPHFHLPSLFQIVRKKYWRQNLFYIKLDFKQAFFNLPIHPSSSFVTTFKAGGTYYKFNRLPFGISIAPYVCQMMLNQIVKYVRDTCPQSWGHIDDVIIGHEDANIL